MNLSTATWTDVEAYLQRSTGLIVPIGSHEQHGPNGLLGTDAICPEAIAAKAGTDSGILIAPTFNVGVAQHHLGFPGTITLRPTTMIAAISDWVASFVRHGFRHVFFVNGHGGNTATIEAAFAEIYTRYSFEDRPSPVTLKNRNWWDFPGVDAHSRRLYPQGLGQHATPAEVSVTYHAHPEAAREVAMSPTIAPLGPVRDSADYRARFPDGRIGSDPSQARAEHGAELVTIAAAALVDEARAFFAETRPGVAQAAE